MSRLPECHVPGWETDDITISSRRPAVVLLRSATGALVQVDEHGSALAIRGSATHPDLPRLRTEGIRIITQMCPPITREDSPS